MKLYDMLKAPRVRVLPAGKDATMPRDEVAICRIKARPSSADPSSAA